MRVADQIYLAVRVLDLSATFTAAVLGGGETSQACAARKPGSVVKPVLTPNAPTSANNATMQSDSFGRNSDMEFASFSTRRNLACSPALSKPTIPCLAAAPR
jgi:hypothetical protein